MIDYVRNQHNSYRFLDLHQVAPQLGPRKFIFNNALNSAPDAERRQTR